MISAEWRGAAQHRTECSSAESLNFLPRSKALRSLKSKDRGCKVATLHNFGCGKFRLLFPKVLVLCADRKVLVPRRPPELDATEVDRLVQRLATMP